MFTSVRIEAKSTFLRNSEVVQQTTVRTTVKGIEEDRMVRCDINGRKADLELKWVKGQLVHVHCMKDHEANEWGRKSGKPVEKFFEMNKKNGVWHIRCKGCGTRWTSAGLPVA